MDMTRSHEREKLREIIKAMDEYDNESYIDASLLYSEIDLGIDDISQIQFDDIDVFYLPYERFIFILIIIILLYFSLGCLAFLFI